MPAKTCPPLPISDAPKPVAGGLTLQHIFLITGGACVLLTAVISRFLVFKHLHRYTFPEEQRQIVRVVVTPIWFSVAALFSIAWYDAALYVQPVGYIYEAFALAALFLLFVHYVAPDPQTREAFFFNLPMLDRKGKETGKGCLGMFKRMWVIVFLYPPLTLGFYVVQWITLATGKYCSNSNSPHFGHFWVTLLTNVITTFAVTAVIRFYGRLKKPMASHKPLWKLVSFKLIVFFNFIQSLIFSFVSGNKSVQAKMGAKFTFDDLSIGLPNLLICIEQVLLALMMHFTFRSREYHPNNGRTRMSTWRAFLDSFNLSDIFIAIARIPVMLAGGSSNARSRTFEGYEANKLGSDAEPMTDFAAPPAGTAGNMPQRTYWSAQDREG
ncbi:MAG: hypothetical protein Q9157_005863 [Trypethelium eluteriae]